MAFLSPFVIVADHELHPVKAPVPQPGEKVLPGAARLPVGHLHTQYLAPAVPVDADGDQCQCRMNNAHLCRSKSYQFEV